MSIEQTFENINNILLYGVGNNEYRKMYKIWPKPDSFNNLVRKWEPVLNSKMGGNSITDSSTRKLCAWLLEEQFKLNKGYSDDSKLLQSALEPYQNCALPIIRRIFSTIKKISKIDASVQYVKHMTITSADIMHIQIPLPIETEPLNAYSSIDHTEFMLGNICGKFSKILEKYVEEGKFLIEPIIFERNEGDDRYVWIRTAIK